mmetsp:Transcript_34302/g.85455  ORF Transcript_34302/g.85455 Transcript_34302/m.85455 type:complete len:82 (+) Transcript_34302:1745-1990(+)
MCPHLSEVEHARQKASIVHDFGRLQLTMSVTTRLAPGPVYWNLGVPGCYMLAGFARFQVFQPCKVEGSLFPSRSCQPRFNY